MKREAGLQSQRGARVVPDAVLWGILYAEVKDLS